MPACGESISTLRLPPNKRMLIAVGRKDETTGERVVSRVFNTESQSIFSSNVTPASSTIS